ncbi:LytR/AlgR family response regulator transcription factor [Sediminicola sp. 1XM1-17]|uniref:LytR/AlgR family response regulator transcription factor n=1 Tax=Sediminicola sp. 1XM1-17 TaxID=3127702 RepID=UPI0030776F9A
MKLKCIIVDDSLTQRLAVSKLITAHKNLTLIGEYSNAIEAKQGIKKEDVDLIFLDVEMPVINGFDFMESLIKSPQIILISGKPDYAVKAFEYNITDYLQKPISPSRLDIAIRRAVDRYEQIHGIHNEEEHIFVKSNLKKRKVILNKVKWIEALGDYIKLVSDEANVIVLSTLTAFENELPKEKFLRIHKSYIVNLDKIERFSGKNVEVEGKLLPLSRHKRENLEKALEKI